MCLGCAAVMLLDEVFKLQTFDKNLQIGKSFKKKNAPEVFAFNS